MYTYHGAEHDMLYVAMNDGIAAHFSSAMKVCAHGASHARATPAAPAVSYACSSTGESMSDVSTSWCNTDITASRTC